MSFPYSLVPEVASDCVSVHTRVENMKDKCLVGQGVAGLRASLEMFGMSNS